MYCFKTLLGGRIVNIKHTGLALSALLATFAFAGCETTPTNTNANRVNANSNTAVVVNNNSNTTVVSNTNSNRVNANVTREEWEKDKARYEKEAKEASSSIGQGANDLWIWTKTRAALTTTDDLRDSTVNVDVANDVITLKGTVATKAQKDKAVEVAKGIEGQKGVKDELKVAPNDSMTNTNTNSAVNGNVNANKK